MISQFYRVFVAFDEFYRVFYGLNWVLLGFQQVVASLTEWNRVVQVFLGRQWFH